MNELMFTVYTNFLLMVPADVPFPQPTPTAPPGSNKFTLVLSWVLWLFWIACIVGFIICGILMAVYNSRGGNEQLMHRFAYVLAGCIVGSVAYPLVNALAS